MKKRTLIKLYLIIVRVISAEMRIVHRLDTFTFW